ncbi:MAG: hypothetical protein M3Y54_20140 [Bacteroidota bacterium]|nr:hypothetical protein [Bacteroidota bacterium]
MLSSATRVPVGISPPAARPLEAGPGQLYQVELQTEQVLGNWTSTNTVTMQLELVRQPLADGQRCTVLLKQFGQTNPEGLHALAADVARLRQRLVFDIDAFGAIVGVANAPELQAQFAALESFLRKKYRDSALITPAVLDNVGQVLADGAHLARVLAEAPEYALLFPDLGHRTFSAQPVPHRPRRLPQVLGAVDVPLQTRAWAVPAPAGVAIAICVEGWPDPEHYCPDEMRQAVRTLSGRYDATAELLVQHLERYEYSATSQLLSAARFTTATIAGVFSSKTVATLLPAAPAEQLLPSTF